MIDEDALNIYTDGSSFQSPRVGGIGIRFITIDSSGNEQIQDIQSPGYLNGTNNQMELKACILALQEAIKLQLLEGVNKVNVYTDSLYIVDNINKAKFYWPKNKWLLKSDRPVINAKLWKELVKCIQKARIYVDFIWVKGHSKNTHNRAVDRMARESAKMTRETRKYNIRNPISIVHVRRKISPNSVEIGCVEMEGQKLSIRVVTSEYLNVQKISKYKYEVLSKKSKYYRKVDIIFSEESLRAGHSYFIRVNNDTFNPRINKVFNEIK